MSRKKIRFRLMFSVVTIALIIATIFTAGTSINLTFVGLAMFALTFAVGLNIVDNEIKLAIAEFLLIIVYIAIFVFLVVV